MKRKVEPLKVKVPAPVPLSDMEKEAIKALDRLSKKWPKTLMLFAYGSGKLAVVRQSNGEILATLDGVYADGGDPGGYVDEKTGREFLSLD